MYMDGMLYHLVALVVVVSSIVVAVAFTNIPLVFREILVKLFMKLPDKFKIDTPVGNYNPDWAIVKQVDGKDHIYMIRETKSTLDESKRRPTENAKIKAAKKHFDAIGIKADSVDYAVGVPGNWSL